VNGMSESAFYISLIVVALVIFGADVGSVLLTVGTILVSTSFAAGEPIKNILLSLIFIVGHRSFDVGDRVVIEGGQTSYVHQIGLLTCTFRTLTNKRYIIATHRLANMTIQNHRRSENSIVEIIIPIGWRTTPEQLDKLAAGMVEWVKQRTHVWVPNIVELYIYSLNPSKGVMDIAFWLGHRLSWQDGITIWADQSRVLMAIK